MIIEEFIYHLYIKKDTRVVSITEYMYNSLPGIDYAGTNN